MLELQEVNIIHVLREQIEKLVLLQRVEPSSIKGREVRALSSCINYVRRLNEAVLLLQERHWVEAFNHHLILELLRMLIEKVCVSALTCIFETSLSLGARLLLHRKTSSFQLIPFFRRS